MNTKTKSLSISTMLSAALFLTLSASYAGVETTQALNGATKTKIPVNGMLAVTFLVDTGTDGILVASRDNIANTTALDFSYAFPDPTNPDQMILIQGAGTIPNSSFQITATTARLVVTTPSDFLLNRCIVDTVAGTFVCTPGSPSSFNLTWVTNGVGSVDETTKRVETLGPITTKFKGTFKTKTAKVNGTWDEHNPPNQSGTLEDTQSMTVIREITVEANP
jgi:hypothetical protein